MKIQSYIICIPINLNEKGRNTYKLYLIQCHDDHQCFFQENLAFGKHTDQKSTAYGGFSRFGVDGDSETKYYKLSCTHTKNTDKPWWRVDLGQEEPVSEVYIVNRGDGLTYRLESFEILVGRLDFLLIL